MSAQRRRRAIALAGLAAALAVFVGGCSNSSSPEANTTQPRVTSPATTTSSSAAGTTVQQGAGGLVFAPTSLTVKTGETITVANVGSASHTFTITGKGVDVVNNPGQSQTVAINLASGTYQFICRFHVSLGMKGTLTVTG